MSERRWKIGELAKAAGVTIRTLRHYEQLGLLSPDRAGSGHRRYGESDVRRLYAVRAMRQLGLPLSEIRRLLDNGADLDARRVLRGHLVHVESELRMLRLMRRRLRRVLESIGRDGGSTDEFLEIMEGMAMFEKYYTSEQLEQLDRRGREIGADAMEAAQREWAELIAAVQAERAKGTDPADPRVIALARRWRELIEAFTGGDPEIEKSLRKMYETEGAAAASRGMVDEGLMAYVGRAMG